jgi:formamidopyrimidine-DNA glycosylase
MRDLGPEPLSDEFTVEYLTRILEGRRGRLKARLLDQTAIAGLGNIYVDESCFRAGVHPGRDCESLTPAEVKRLHGAIREVIAEGIAHRGTTFRDYLDGDGRVGEYQERLAVYGRAKQPCQKCGSIITRSVVAGRGTFVCPKCQGQPGSADREETPDKESPRPTGAQRTQGSGKRKKTR